jgi:hypothetical protein
MWAHCPQAGTLESTRWIPTRCGRAWQSCGDRRCRSPMRFAYCHLAVAPDGYPPRIAGVQHVPLWKMLPAPTLAITETGPYMGPGFFVRLKTARCGPMQRVAESAWHQMQEREPVIQLAVIRSGLLCANADADDPVSLADSPLGRWPSGGRLDCYAIARSTGSVGTKKAAGLRHIRGATSSYSHASLACSAGVATASRKSHRKYWWKQSRNRRLSQLLP